MTSDGVKKARTFRRLPEPDRWTLEAWDELKGLPWLWTPPRTKMPRSSPIPISDAPLPVQVAGEKEPPKPRRFHIREPFIEKYGWTPGCRGCEAALRGDPNEPSRNHIETCRKRFEEAIAKDEQRGRDEDVIMDVEESESKKSKVSEASRKRQSETDIRDLDVERSQRDEEAQASGSGQKRSAEDPPDDSERGERLGVLDEAGGRPPAESRTLSRNLLDRIYQQDGHEYNHEDCELVLNLSLIHISEPRDRG